MSGLIPLQVDCNQNQTNKTEKVSPDTRVHLQLLPYWANLAPPLGISVLKGYLLYNGVQVSTSDLNVSKWFHNIAVEYFDVLKDIVEENKRSNFYMIAYDVFSTHLMIYLNYINSSSKENSFDKYQRLIGLVLEKNYYVFLSKINFNVLDEIAKRFFELLEVKVIETIEQYKPTIYGVSTYSTSLAASLFALQTVRSRYPEIITVMGGGVFADQLNPASVNWEPFLKQTESYLDHIIIGEGEEIFLEFLKGNLKKERVFSLKTHNMRSLDLAATVIPNFADFDTDDYVQMSSYATRSCPFQCSFCSETVQWGKFRTKTPKQILEELTQINTKYGGRLFLFGDSLINQVVSGLAEEMIQNNQNFFYDAYLRADPEVCVESNAALWRRGGFYRARFGIESGSSHVLDMMNKQIAPEQAALALKTMAEAGIKTTTYWVVGHPGETDQDFAETLQFLEDNADYIYEADWHPFYFFPQGQVYSKKWKKEYGMDVMYPEEYTDLLLTRVWVLNTRPSPQQLFERMNQFSATCRKLGIPNPYSIKDIAAADDRWMRLHKNAVPPLVELMNFNIA